MANVVPAPIVVPTGTKVSDEPADLTAAVDGLLNATAVFSPNDMNGEVAAGTVEPHMGLSGAVAVIDELNVDDLTVADAHNSAPGYEPNVDNHPDASLIGLP